MADRRHHWLAVLPRLAASGLLLGLLFWKLDMPELAAHLGRLTPGLILFAWGYYAGCQLLSSYRWQLFLTAKGVNVPVSRLFTFYMKGMFLNNLLPGAVGGDVVKTFYLYRHTRNGHYAVISVFLERFTGLVGLSVLSLAGLALGWRHLGSPVVVVAVMGTALFLLTMALFIWWPPLARKLTRLSGRLMPRRGGETVGQLRAALASYNRHPMTLLQAVALSVLIQSLYAGLYALVSQSLGIAISMLYFVLFLPLVSVVTLVPISFGGLGLREVVLVLLFAEVGVAAADVLAVSLTVYVLTTLLSLWGGVLLLLPQTDPAVGEIR